MLNKSEDEEMNFYEELTFRRLGSMINVPQFKREKSENLIQTDTIGLAASPKKTR